MIIVHHLDDSRSQRILWLLEELGEPHEIEQHRRDPVTRSAPVAGVFGLSDYPNIQAWIRRFQARSAFQRALAKGGRYRFAVT
jgi:glutathione S-transferase